jgi:hypothetical protein
MILGDRARDRCINLVEVRYSLNLWAIQIRKNKQKQQAQHSAKKASNQKKPAVSTASASGKKK